MAFINETVSSMSDFATKLDAFAVANGWTQDEFNAGTGRFALHKSTVYVSFRWDTGTPQSLGIYQALGWVGATDPGNHTDDSGNGKVSGTQATIATGRSVFLDNPVQWWGFEDDTYIHFIVEISGGIYIHGGFGLMDKIGDWTGGEYAYGYKHKTGTASSPAISVESSVLLDGLASFSNIEDFVATVHMEGLQNQQGGGSGKWGVCVGAHATFGNDRAAVARGKVVGGFRGGPLAVPWGRFSVDTEKGLQPMYPLLNWYVDTTAGDTHPLGWMKDVRGFNGEFRVAAEEVVIGGDTWVVFPSRNKGTSPIINTSAHQFIAYKQVA